MINLDGANLIFATSFGYFDPFMVDMAKKYPDVQFRHAAPLWNKDKHPMQRRLLLRLSQPGALRQRHRRRPVAPRPTRSASSPPSRSRSVLRNINSFAARRAQGRTRTPTVQVIFTGDWSLPVREAEATNALVDAGCDVITCHVDSPKVVIETAEGRGVKSCGHNASQAPLAPKGFITGAEYKWETIYKTLRRHARQGRDAAELRASAATTTTWCRTRPTAPARRPRPSQAADAAIADLKAGKPIYVGPLKDNKGKVVVDKTFDNYDPYARRHELPGRGRRRLDHLIDRQRGAVSGGRPPRPVLHARLHGHRMAQRR